MILVMCPKCQVEFAADNEQQAAKIGRLHSANVHPVTSPEVPA